MHKSISSTLLAAAVLTGGVVGVSAVAGAEPGDDPVLTDLATAAQVDTETADGDSGTDLQVQDPDESETDGAESEGEGCDRRRGHHRAGRDLGVVAEVLGLEVDELRDQLTDGASIADVAGDQTDDVIDALVAEKTERLDQAVADGRITQDEADEKLADITQRITERVTTPRPDRGAPAPGAAEGENA